MRHDHHPSQSIPTLGPADPAGGYLTASKWGRRLLATLDASRPSLDEAWAEAEAVLPRERGWFDLFRRDAAFHDDPDHRYCAEAYTFRPSADDVAMPSVEDYAGFGPTPAAALQALAARLREQVR